MYLEETKGTQQRTGWRTSGKNENFTTNLFYNAGITVKHCLPYKWELSLRTLYFSPEGVLPMSSSLPPSASLSNVSRIKSCFQISSHISFSRIEKCVCQFRKGGLASHLAHCYAMFLWCLWATNKSLTWRESQLVFSTWRIASLRTCSPTCNNMAIITVSRQCKAMARPWQSQGGAMAITFVDWSPPRPWRWSPLCWSLRKSWGRGGWLVLRLFSFFRLFVVN